MLHGVFERARRVWNLPANPVADVVRKRDRHSNDLDFYSAEELMQLVAAAASEQDAAIFLTAAFTGLRSLGERRERRQSSSVRARRRAISLASPP
jgi:integrase